MAAAAAMAGLIRCVRPPRPWRPSKLRFDVETLRSPGARISAFIPTHIEQSASRHSNHLFLLQPKDLRLCQAEGEQDLAIMLPEQRWIVTHPELEA